MKKIILSLFLLSGINLFCVVPNKTQNVDKVDNVAVIEEDQNDSTFFAQLRWFAIAGISLQTLSIALDKMRDSGHSIVHVTDPRVIDALYVVLVGSFGIWIADKVKYMDPIANYWIRRINKGYDRLNNSK